MTGLLPDLLQSAAGTPDSVALRHGDTSVRYAELARIRSRPRRALCAAGSKAGPGCDLSQQASGDRRHLFRRRSRRRRVRPGQPLAQGRTGGAHTARLGCVDPRHERRPSRRRRHGGRIVAGSARSGRRRRRTGRAAARGSRAARVARAARGRSAIIAPRDRHRRRGDPLHLRQHRPSEGRGAVTSQHDAGATSVAGYLDNTPDDRLLAVLPFSFDYGFSQLTTAFLVGASVSLIDHLFARDVVTAVQKDRITGLAAVPPL